MQNFNRFAFHPRQRRGSRHLKKKMSGSHPLREGQLCSAICHVLSLMRSQRVPLFCHWERVRDFELGVESLNVCENEVTPVTLQLLSLVKVLLDPNRQSGCRLEVMDSFQREANYAEEM